MAIWSTGKTFTRITVNGQTYSGVEEMPPEVRRQYEQAMSMLADKNNNGIPDVLEGAGGDQRPKTIIHKEMKTTHLIGGGPVDLDGSRIVQLTWPTLLALLATAAVVAGWVVWMMLNRK